MKQIITSTVCVVMPTSVVSVTTAVYRLLLCLKELRHSESYYLHFSVISLISYEVFNNKILVSLEASNLFKFPLTDLF